VVRVADSDTIVVLDVEETRHPGGFFMEEH
jgi:hypothetical protein